MFSNRIVLITPYNIIIDCQNQALEWSGSYKGKC